MTIASEQTQMRTSPISPDRDDLGDVISQFNTENGYWTGIAFDGELLWGVDTEGGRLLSVSLDGEVEESIQLPLQAAGFDDEDDESMHGICWDGEAFWLSSWFRSELFRVSRRGELLGQINLPERGNAQGAWGITWDGENLWYLPNEGDGILRQINTDGELIRRVDCSEVPGSEEIISFEWVPAHEGDHMWWHVGDTDDDANDIFRLNLEGDEAEIINEFDAANVEAFGLTHDGENLWYVTSNEDNDEWLWYEIDDGIEEEVERNPEIMVEPEEFDFGVVFSAELGGSGEIDISISNVGNSNLVISEITIEDENFSIEFENELVIEPEEQFESTARFEPVGEYGDYAATIVITSNDPERGELEINLSGIHANGWLGIDNAIPDIEIDEVFGEVIIADLDTVFVFPHMDGLALYVDDLEGLTFEISREHVLSMSSVENFNGDSILVVVTAAYAPPNVAQDDFLVTINPVNDLPGMFGLSTPENDASVNYADTVAFSWESSIDPDPDDTVSYLLHIDLWDEWYAGDPMAVWDFAVEGVSFEVAFSDLTYLIDQFIGYPVEWRVFAISNQDTVECQELFTLSVLGPNSVGQENGTVYSFDLQSIYPNPFNASTTIKYSLPIATNITLGLYNPQGQLVAVLYEGLQATGEHSAVFSAIDTPTGLYFVKMEAGTDVRLKKMLLIK